jgi:hypothetical protein
VKIACDVVVSNRTINFLKKNGFDVVLKADAGQSDRDWFNSALALGTTVFISDDYDIAGLIEKEHDKKLFWVRFGSRKYDEGKVNFWLMERLNRLKEVWGL